MSHIKEFEHLKISLEAIKLATNNFAADSVIGRGGFGRVYRGEIVHYKGQSIVAIKRLDRAYGQGNPEFWKEITMLSLYQHKNIVSLVGFCDEGDEKILMYEYASKRSLDLYLNSDHLTWIQRLQICIGAARGLAYLHSHRDGHTRVLHRDIKSSNILLDENWNAMISDFGLARFGLADQRFSFLFSNPVGTFGYWDPLYVETGFLTKESDVYSFGVVLFELLCGRLCMGDSGDKRQPLTRLAREMYEQKKISEIVFGNMKDEINPNSLEVFSTIAYRCLNKNREERPLMKEVVEILEDALKYQVSYVFDNMKDEIYRISLEVFSTIADRCLNKSREERPLMKEVIEKLEAALKCQANEWSLALKLYDRVDPSLVEVYKLVEEYSFIFNKKYLAGKVLAGEWDEAERYLSLFTTLEENRYSLKMIFEIRKQKYLEALDRNDRTKAVEILMKDLKIFSGYNDELFKDMTLLIRLDNFREHEDLSGYGEETTARHVLLNELIKLIDANPLLGKKPINFRLPDLDNEGSLTLKRSGTVDSSQLEVYKLEEESSSFFNLKYLAGKVLAGEWDEAERYFSRFTKLDDNRYSLKIFFDIRKHKYLEALDRNDRAKAVEILLNDLKIFSDYNDELFKELTLLIRLHNFREHEDLSAYGDVKKARHLLLNELIGVINANPLIPKKPFDFPPRDDDEGDLMQTSNSDLSS